MNPPIMHPDIVAFWNSLGYTIELDQGFVDHYFDAKKDNGRSFVVAHVRYDVIQYYLGEQLGYYSPFYNEQQMLRLIKLKAFL